MNKETKTTINGDVHQDVPTDLTNVTINGTQPPLHWGNVGISNVDLGEYSKTLAEENEQLKNK